MKIFWAAVNVLGIVLILLFTWGAAIGNLSSGGGVGHSIALFCMGVVWSLFFNIAMKGRY